MLAKRDRAVGAKQTEVRMRRLAIGVLFLIVACSDPRSTKIPADMSDLPKIQSALDKLDSVDRGRVAQYEMRAHLGAIFGNSPPPAGVTIGEAIDNQKAFAIAQAKEEAAEKARTAAAAKALTEKLRLMSEALAVSLTRLEVQGAPSDQFGQFIYMRIAFQNRGPKAIAGVKGIAIFRDMFGDTVARKTVSYEKGIPVNSGKEWRELVGATMVDASDRKLAQTPIEKVKFSFEPSIIIFDDGSKLEVSVDEAKE
jgi:hypothetical protein